MVASELITDIIFPVKTSDTGDVALNIMADAHISHLPIVNRRQLLGVVSESDILSHDTFEPIGSYRLSLIRAFVKENAHVFEIMEVLAKNELTIVPVINDEEEYIGVVTAENLLKFFAESFSFQEQGAIIVVDISEKDYYLSELARIIESENTQIISSFITRDKNSTNMLITLKLNRRDIGGIISALNRYDYKIRATFTEGEYIDGLKERFENFMHYLNI